MSTVNPADETPLVSPLARQAICSESQSADYYPEGLSTELRDADTVYKMMLTRGVIIRPSTTWRTGDYVRITIGTPEQNERCMGALRDVLEELSSKGK